MKTYKSTEMDKNRRCLGYWLSNSKKAKIRNINTALDFIAPQHEHWIRKEMGVTGLRLKYELEGKSVLDLEPISEQKKSIAITRSFQNN